MYTARSRLNVITRRDNVDPIGITFEAGIDEFKHILRRIATHDLDCNDPARGLRDILSSAYCWSSSLYCASTNLELLEAPDSESLTIDFARREVHLRLWNGTQMRCDLEADAVRPLFEAAQDSTKPFPYLRADPLPERATVRVIEKRSGQYGSGMDIHFTRNGAEAASGLLESLRGLSAHSIDSVLSRAWCADDTAPLAVPFEGITLGDEYGQAPPPPFPSDCPALIVDLADESVRLSDDEGYAIMVVDVVPEGIDRLRSEFNKRAGVPSRPVPQIFDGDLHPDLHPDYTLSAEDLRFPF